MIDPAEPETPNLSGLVSVESRARLHRRLDELLDQQNEIAGSVSTNGMSEKTASLLQHWAEQLTIRSIRLAGEVAGGDARAIAFRHEDPTSRAAFARFFNVAADYAAPYAYATLDLGLRTFTWTDAMAILDDLRSLEFGDTPARLAPSLKLRPKGSRYSELCEKWRAVQWVAYITAKWGSKVAALNEVEKAYGVSSRSLSSWEHETENLIDGHWRDWALEDARRDGAAGSKPNFTCAPYGNEQAETYADWLGFDAERYSKLVAMRKRRRKIRDMKRKGYSASAAFSSDG